ncbi:hypothetical protein RJ640_023386, partial [Escallonia rubra]
ETRHSGAQLPSHCRELAEISNTSKPLKEQNDRSYEEPNDRTSNAYTPWVPDPVTGYYRPENRAKELDPPGIFRLDPPGIFRLDPPGIFKLDPLGIRSFVSLTLLLNFFFPFSFAAWSSLLSREWRSGTRVDDAGIALCYTETRHSGAQLPSHCRELAEISNTSKPLKEQNDRSYEEPNDRTSNAYTPWVPDPVTGYYRPENRAKELDPPGIFRLDPPGIFRLDPPGIFKLDPLGIRSFVSLTLLLNFFFPFSFAAWSSLLSREWRSGTRVDDAGIALCYTLESDLDYEDYLNYNEDSNDYPWDDEALANLDNSFSGI